MTETQKAYQIGDRWNDEFHGTTWATLDLAEKETERLYRESRKLHKYVQLDWKFNAAVRWWQLLRDSNDTGYYVEEVEIRGATFAKFDVDALVARILSAYGDSPENLEKAVREFIGGM